MYEPDGPRHYYPDGQPILSDENEPAWKKWATLFEDSEARIIGQSKTLYGERLSTVWLGLDHNFFAAGPPLIFETMLFAPKDPELTREFLNSHLGDPLSPEKQCAYADQMAHIKSHFPHDQFQLRYATRREAERSYAKLRLQCLIPPRWRHFLLWTIGGQQEWRLYDDADAE